MFQHRFPVRVFTIKIRDLYVLDLTKVESISELVQLVSFLVHYETLGQNKVLSDFDTKVGI